jgi:hypothetical protein
VARRKVRLTRYLSAVLPADVATLLGGLVNQLIYVCMLATRRRDSHSLVVLDCATAPNIVFGPDMLYE